MGIWWGLRVAADGSGAGLPVLVIGGTQADIAVAEPTAEAGTNVARLLLGSSVSAVVDVADMKRPSNLHFVGALLKELYENHAREPLWIVLEYLSAESWVDKHHGLSSPHPRLPLPRYLPWEAKP